MCYYVDMSISEYESITIAEMTKLLQAIAENSRLRLLKCLQARSACVCELIQATGMSQTRVSRHLGILKDAGLVKDEREAQWVAYSLAQPPAGTLTAALLALLAEWGEDDEQVVSDRKRLASAQRSQASEVAE